MLPRGKKTFTDNDLMMYLALGLKHLRLMVLLLCLSLALGLAYFTYARPLYYSKAAIRYYTLDRSMDADKTFQEQYSRRIVSVLKSTILTEATARKFGIKGNATTVQLRWLPKQTIAFNPDHTTIFVETYSYSTDWSRNWATKLVEAFEEYRQRQRAERINAINSTLPREIEEARQKWEEVFNTKFEFHDTNEMTKILIELNQYKDLPRQLVVVKRQLALMRSTRTALTGGDAVTRLSLLAGLKRELEQTELDAKMMKMPELNVGEVIAKEDGNPGMVVLPSMTPAQQQPWEDLDRQHRQVEQTLADLGRKFLSGHPKVAAARKELDKINKAIEVECETALARFDLDYAFRETRVKELEAKLPEYDEVVRRNAKYLQEYARFDAGHIPLSKVINDLSKRVEAADFVADKDRVYLEFSSIDAKETPVSPQKLKLLLKSFLLGLGLALAIPFLLEYMDSRVSDVEQVEETLRIRGLGIVPKVTEVPVDQLVLSHSDSKTDHHIQENFRLIRTNLTMNSPSPELPQIILVTSAMPQEGKTVVSANLAASFARKGEKTLLIDADLRRGRLHRMFACPGKPGLTELLTHNKTIEEMGHVIGNGTMDGRLTLLTCGKHIHHATELLDSAVFPAFLADLRQKYQRIIIDSPPVLGLSETSVMQRHADGVLMVIWSDYTPLRDVKTAITTLQTNGAKFCGFVLNRLDFASLTNRYKYFYYSPYYYSSYKPLEGNGQPPPPPAELTSV